MDTELLNTVTGIYQMGYVGVISSKLYNEDACGGIFVGVFADSGRYRFEYNFKGKAEFESPDPLATLYVYVENPGDEHAIARDVAFALLDEVRDAVM